MKKISFLLSIIAAASLYVFTAMHSLHQVHKIIYFDNIKLSQDYVEWDEVRTNIKDYINARLLDEISSDTELKKSGEVGFLVAGLAGKLAEHAVDTYINSEGLSLLIENSSRRSQIPEPGFGTLIAGISIMRFDGLNSFYVNLESDGEKLPVHFKRIGAKWKIVQIEFSDDFINTVTQN